MGNPLDGKGLMRPWSQSRNVDGNKYAKCAALSLLSLNLNSLIFKPPCLALSNTKRVLAHDGWPAGLDSMNEIFAQD